MGHGFVRRPGLHAAVQHFPAAALALVDTVFDRMCLLPTNGVVQGPPRRQPPYDEVVVLVFEGFFLVGHTHHPLRKGSGHFLHCPRHTLTPYYI